MVTHYSTILPLPCLSMQERTGLRVFTELWAYVQLLDTVQYMNHRPAAATLAPRPSPFLLLPTAAVTASPGAALTRTSGGAFDLACHAGTSPATFSTTRPPLLTTLYAPSSCE